MRFRVTLFASWQLTRCCCQNEKIELDIPSSLIIFCYKSFNGLLLQKRKSHYLNALVLMIKVKNVIWWIMGGAVNGRKFDLMKRRKAFTSPSWSWHVGVHQPSRAVSIWQFFMQRKPCTNHRCQVSYHQAYFSHLLFDAPLHWYHLLGFFMVKMFTWLKKIEIRQRLDDNIVNSSTVHLFSHAPHIWPNLSKCSSSKEMLLHQADYVICLQLYLLCASRDCVRGEKRKLHMSTVCSVWQILMTIWVWVLDS